MTDASGSFDDVATYLVQTWREECRRRGDAERPWPEALSMGVARALTEQHADPDRQVIELELRAVTFLGAAPRSLSAWRLGVLDEVLRAGGSEYGLASIAHLLDTGSGSAEASMAPSELVPDVAEAEPDVTEAQPDVTEAQSDVTEAQSDVTEAQSDVTEAQPDVTEAQPDVTEAQPDVAEAVVEAIGHGSETVTEGSETVTEEAETVTVGLDASEVAPEATEATTEATTEAAPEAMATWAEGAGDAPLVSSDPSETAADAGAQGAEAPAARAGEGGISQPTGDDTDRTQHVVEVGPQTTPPPFWARIDATSASAALPGEVPSTEEEAQGTVSTATPGTTGTPWPDELEAVELPSEVEGSAGPSAPPDAKAAASTSTTTSTGGGGAELSGAAPPAPSPTDVVQAAGGSGPVSQVSVSDRVNFEATVCRLVDEKVEFSVTFVGLDEVPGALLGVPETTDVTEAEEAASQDLSSSLARRFAGRGTCYAIGRGLAAVVVEGGRPKEVDRSVRKLPSTEVPASFSWGSARFPEEANDVRELLRMALVRLANMREEKLAPRVLVSRIRRVVSARG